MRLQSCCKNSSEHWVAWAGPPKELRPDPAQTNLGDPMVTPREMRGIHIRPIAAGAHWQLGKTESHGGWSPMCWIV